jgi:Spy/CpxP family protein refolding chaperone
MQHTIFRQLKLLALLVALIGLTNGSISAQQTVNQAQLNPPATVGKGMGMITPSLMEIGMKTRFFLAISDRIKMTEAQTTQITEIAFRFQKLAAEKKGDLGVADAELQRMLGREPINLRLVKSKLNELQLLEADVEYAGIESVLKAIKVLTHEQHLVIMTLVANSASEQQKWQSQ